MAATHVPRLSLTASDTSGQALSSRSLVHWTSMSVMPRMLSEAGTSAPVNVRYERRGADPRLKRTLSTISFPSWQEIDGPSVAQLQHVVGKKQQQQQQQSAGWSLLTRPATARRQAPLLSPTTSRASFEQFKAALDSVWGRRDLGKERLLEMLQATETVSRAAGKPQLNKQLRSSLSKLKRVASRQITPRAPSSSSSATLVSTTTASTSLSSLIAPAAVGQPAPVSLTDSHVVTSSDEQRADDDNDNDDDDDDVERASLLRSVLIQLPAEPSLKTPKSPEHRTRHRARTSSSAGSVREKREKKRGSRHSAALTVDDTVVRQASDSSQEQLDIPPSLTASQTAESPTPPTTPTPSASVSSSSLSLSSSTSSMTSSGSNTALSSSVSTAALSSSQQSSTAAFAASPTLLRQLMVYRTASGTLNIKSGPLASIVRQLILWLQELSSSLQKIAAEDMTEALFYSYRQVATTEQLLALVQAMYQEDVDFPSGTLSESKRAAWLERARRPVILFLERWLIFAYCPDFADYPAEENILSTTSTSSKKVVTRRLKTTPAFHLLLNFIQEHLLPEHQTLLSPWFNDATREKEVRRRFDEAMRIRASTTSSSSSSSSVALTASTSSSGSSLSAPAKKLSKTVSSSRLRKGEHGRMTIGRSGKSFFGSMFTSSLPNDPEFMDFTADEIALHLTLFESKLFRRITASELLNKPWEVIRSDRTVTGNLAIAVMTDRFNKVAKWVATTIVTLPSPKLRSEAIKRWIMVAQSCFSYCNFNSLMAIISGLNHTAVTRLSKSWDDVSDRYVQQLRHLENEEMSFSGHMRAYRNHLDRAMADGVPAVPLITVHIQDLFVINDANPTYVDDADPSSPQCINFDKLYMTGRVIAMLLHLQQIPEFEGEIGDPDRAEKAAYFVAKLPNTYQDQLLRETSLKHEPRVGNVV